LAAAVGLLPLGSEALATTIVAASANNAALVDTNSDELGNSTFIPGGGRLAIGERNSAPPTTDEFRYWLPFDPTPADRKAVARAKLVMLEVQHDEKQNVSSFDIDVHGIPGRTSSGAVASDYQAASSTIVPDAWTSAVPLGRRSMDVTAFAKLQAALPNSVLAFRAQADPPGLLPDGDGLRNNYIVPTQQNTNASLRPVLTAVPGVRTRLLDDFENGSIGTGGLNGGFMLVTNGAGGSGAASETASHATVQTTGGGFDNSGLVSVNTFKPFTDFTAVWSVASATTPDANGLNLSLQSQPGFWNTGGGRPNLLFRFEGDGDFALRAHDGSSEVDLTTDSFDVGSFNDGFTVVGRFDPTGWEYTIVGLLGLSNATNSGAWTLSHNYDTLFDSTTHIGAFIQTGGSGNQTLILDRMAVLDDVPEPTTLTLLGLGGLGLLARRRRKRIGAKGIALLALCLAMGPAAHATPYTDIALGNVPIGYWRLNESSFGGSGDATDASLEGHDGTYTNTGAITLAQPGPRPGSGFLGFETGNNAPDFASSGDGRVVLPGGFLPTGTSPRTIMGWFNGTSSTVQNFFNYGQDTQGNRVSITAGNSRVAVAVHSHNFGIDGLGLPAGWHHLAVTLPPGSTQSDQWRFFVDGVERTSEAGDIAGSVQTLNTVDIGGRRIGPNVGGRIDEVAVFDRALSADEVGRHHRLATEPLQRLSRTDITFTTVDADDDSPAAGAAFAGAELFVRERAIASQTDRRARAFLKFDLGSLAGLDIAGAVLKLHEYNTLNNANTEDLFVAQVDQDWDTGSNPPTFSQPIVAGSEIFFGDNGAAAGPAVDIDFLIDVTDMVKAWQADPASNYGVRLRIGEDFVGAAFDHLGEDAPELILYVTPEPTTLSLLGLGAMGLAARRRRRR
jgi:hypothetical protein